MANSGDLTRLSRQILDKARTDGAVEVIVGLPLDSNGIMSHRLRNFNGQLCLNFSQVLCSVAGAELPRCKVLLVDERYTTREAKLRMKAERIRASLDAMSAACLLERYLEDRGEGALAAVACAYPPPRELERFDYGVVRDYIRETYYSSSSFSSSQGGSVLARKQATMQKLKDGELSGKHHLYFAGRQAAGGRGRDEIDEEDDEEDEGEDDSEEEDDDDDDEEELAEMIAQAEAEEREVAASMGLADEDDEDDHDNTNAAAAAGEGMSESALDAIMAGLESAAPPRSERGGRLAGKERGLLGRDEDGEDADEERDEEDENDDDDDDDDEDEELARMLAMRNARRKKGTLRRDKGTRA